MNSDYKIHLAIICLVVQNSVGFSLSLSATDKVQDSSIFNMGTVFPRDSRIIGGRVAHRGEFPYQLSLRYIGRHLCGAVVINSRGALTAAHCVVNLTRQSNFSIVAGDYKLNQIERGEQYVKVTKIIPHPLYGQVEDENDIAYLHLEKDLIFSRFVQPIEIATDEKLLPENSLLTTSGWGRTHDGQAGALIGRSNILRTVDLPLVTNRQCSITYSNATEPVSIADTMLCAGDQFVGGRDACTGDSGGPLVVRHRLVPSNLFSKQRILVGITSFGIGCGQVEYPGVFTRVSKYRKWIEEVRNELMVSEEQVNKKEEEQVGIEVPI